MADFKIGDHAYQSGRIDLFRQAHVLRRLGPILPSLNVIWRAHEGGASVTDAAAMMVNPLIDSMSRLSDADAEYVFNACLAVTQRKQGEMWANIVAPGGGRMFDDIGLYEMGAICWYVLQDNFRPFVSALRAIAPSAGQKTA